MVYFIVVSVESVLLEFQWYTSTKSNSLIRTLMLKKAWISFHIKFKKKS